MKRQFEIWRYTDLMKAFLFICLNLIWITNSAFASPVSYEFDQDRSRVGFTYYLNSEPRRGTMPVVSSEITIDLANLARSSVRVSLQANDARTGFFLATQAMQGRTVLDTRNHPLIRFESLRVRPTAQGAEITGNLTVRGTTRPVTLTGQLFRQNAETGGDPSGLSILLTGSLNRSDFGATGYPNLVEDKIDLRILVRISPEN